MIWNFNGVTVYGQTFTFKIKASNKEDAIQKGIDTVKSKLFCNTNRFTCTLQNV